MAPKLGDTVFVNETDPLTDEDAVSVGIVTAVLSDKDSGGDTGWWKAVQSKAPVQVQVFRRNGTTESVLTTEGETVQDDEGRDRWQSGTYSTSPDGPAKPVQGDTPQATPPTQAAPGSPTTSADTQSGDGTTASTSGAQTSTSPGWTDQPQG